MTSEQYPVSGTDVTGMLSWFYCGGCGHHGV
jgi:hypothetical protein